MTAPAEPIAQPARFALERFAWEGPDRLEVSGWFEGLDVELADRPVLVVEGGDANHRLPAVPDRLSGPPNGQQRWWAAFAWDDAPAAFERARLELGAGLAIDLPQPRPKRTRRGERMLEVRRPEPLTTSEAAADRLAFHAELLLAREEAQSLRAVLERTQRELERARHDVEAERSGRAADSQRFRDSLGRVRASAEDAISNERAMARRLAHELEDARRRMEEQAERTAALEHAAKEAAGHRSSVEAACAETEQLLARLTSLRDVMGNGKAA